MSLPVPTPRPPTYAEREALLRRALDYLLGYQRVIGDRPEIHAPGLKPLIAEVQTSLGAKPWR